jgi:hypothetical protein
MSYEEGNRSRSPSPRGSEDGYNRDRRMHHEPQQQEEAATENFTLYVTNLEFQVNHIFNSHFHQR